MAIKFEKIEPGMRLLDVRRTKMGNTNMSRLGAWTVEIVSVDATARTAMVRWNGNAAELWNERQLTKLYVAPPKALRDQEARERGADVVKAQARGRLLPWKVSWYDSKLSRAWEYCGPWWISGETGDGRRIFCAAVMAESAEAAKKVIADAHDEPLCYAALDWRFCVEREDGWDPFSERFPRAAWMVWPFPTEAKKTSRPVETARPSPAALDEARETSRKSSPSLRALGVSEAACEAIASFTIEYRRAIDGELRKLPKETFGRLAEAGRLVEDGLRHDALVCRRATYLDAIDWHMERARALGADVYCVYHACDKRECAPRHEVKMEKP
jgi:hypothetical protein